jgi:hypothetical protein
MKSAKIFATKKPIGRPRAGVGIQVGMRWQERDLVAIDEWRRRLPDLPSRTESIRRLVGLALAKSMKKREAPKQ